MNGEPWICPRCSTVNAPWAPMCYGLNCASGNVGTTGNSTGKGITIPCTHQTLRVIYGTPGYPICADCGASVPPGLSTITSFGEPGPTYVLESLS